MILKPAAAALFAYGLITPETPQLGFPKPVIVKPENIDFSKHMLLGMPLTMGMLASSAMKPVSLINRETTHYGAGAATTYTATARSIGTASSTRRVIALITGNSGTNSRTVSSVTIGGISATIHSQGTSSNSGSSVSCIASATVTSGTTADVVVTFSGTMTDCSVACTAIDNLQSTTPTFANTVTGGGGVLSLTDSTVDWSANGFSCGVVSLGLTPKVTWSTLTEYTDATVQGGTRRVSMADGFPTTAATNTTVTTSWGSNPTRSAMSIVTFR